MNNPENVRLEVFTIPLKPVEGYNINKFEDLILNISGIDANENLFIEFYKKFINHIDLEYKEIRGKAFTLSTNKLEYGYDNDNHSIWGVLKGGPKGNGKTKSHIKNRETEEELDDNVINDKYFFYLHFPLESKYGYLFFQIYGGDNIRKEFVQHILDLFKISGKYNKPNYNPILPNSIRDEFKNNSKIIELSYTTNSLSSSFTENAEFSNLCDKYKIEISIKPIGNNKISSERVGLMNSILSNLKFNNTLLLDANKKKVSLQSLTTSKTSTFVIDTSEVMPRIYLDGRVKFDKNGSPDFDELKVFCDNLLRELISGEYERIARL